MAGEQQAAQAAASLFASLIGTKQLGQAAPAFGQGGMGMPVSSSSLLSDAPTGFGGFSPQPSGLLGSPPIEEAITTPASVEGGATQSKPGFGGGFTTQQNEPVGPPEGLAGAPSPTGLNGFFGNLDQNMQSPSKMLGLGILSQIDPRLAQAGLFAGGMFGQNKVF